MRTLPTLAIGLTLTALSVAAAAQSTPSPTTSPRQTTPTTSTTARRAATYKGPRVVKNTKALGDKFIRDSKPTPKPVSPAKQ